MMVSSEIKLFYPMLDTWLCCIAIEFTLVGNALPSDSYQPAAARFQGARLVGRSRLSATVQRLNMKESQACPN